MKYRPLSYWAWLDNVDAETQPAQAEEIFRGGYGGFVAHARGGLVTPYLGEDWTAAARASAEVAKQRGGLAIWDDEYGWPSGFGGGRVTALGPDAQLKILRFKRAETAADVPARTLWRSGKDCPCDCIYAEVVPEYADNLSPRAVEEFIRAGYEPYRCGDGYFTDEPQLARTGVPYSDVLPGAFRAAYGEELAPLLPALFSDTENCAAVRHDYYSLVSRLFRENYARRIGEWCAARGRLLLGHFCWEENLALQIQSAGAVMPLYAHMSVPGVDALLRESPDEMCVLQMTSVAEQTGKARKLSESYGAAGWNISFAERRHIAEKQMVLGVDLLLDHLYLGSLRGGRKREFPASLSPAQPWWAYSRLYCDPVARLSELVSEGVYAPEILVLHPMKTAFCEYAFAPERAGDPDFRLPAERALRAVTSALLAEGFAFHYGDEDLIAEIGGVSGARLTVGKMRYSAVVLPGVLTLEGKTFAFLSDFAAAGGKIYCTERRPELLGGRPDGGVRDFFSDCAVLAPGELGAALKCIPRPLIAKRKSGSAVYVRSMEYRGRRVHYLVNSDPLRPAEFSAVCSARSLLFWNPDTGKETGAADRENLRIPGGGSMVLFESGEDIPPRREPDWIEQARFTRAEIVRRSPNALVLDCAELSEDGGAFAPPEYLPEIQSALLRRGRNGRVCLRFRFCAEPGAGELSLAIERPDRAVVRLNGGEVRGDDRGCWADSAIRLIGLGAPRTGENILEIERDFWCSERTYRIKNDPALHEAEGNRVTVETELESAVLLGDFELSGRLAGYGEHRSVFFRRDFTVLPPRREHCVCDFTEDGFPFFAGSLTARIRFEGKAGGRYRLNFGRPDAIVVAVRLNGARAGETVRAPWTVELSGVREGWNEAEVEFVSSLRNAFGPSHLLAGESYVVSPGHFLKLGPDMFTEQYASVRFGAEAGIALERAEK